MTASSQNANVLFGVMGLGFFKAAQIALATLRTTAAGEAGIYASGADGYLYVSTGTGATGQWLNLTTELGP